MQASGSVIVTSTVAESQASMVIDDVELQALLALRKIKVCNGILHLKQVSFKLIPHFTCVTLVTYFCLLQDKNEASLHLNHSVPALKRLGLPANAAVALNSGSHGNGSHFYIFNSNAGKQRVRAVFSILKQLMDGKSSLKPLKLRVWDHNNVNVTVPQLTIHLCWQGK